MSGVVGGNADRNGVSVTLENDIHVGSVVQESSGLGEKHRNQDNMTVIPQHQVRSKEWSESLRRRAFDFDAVKRAEDDAELSLSEVAAESGYSSDHLRRFVA